MDGWLRAEEERGGGEVGLSMVLYDGRNQGRARRGAGWQGDPDERAEAGKYQRDHRIIPSHPKKMQC